MKYVVGFLRSFAAVTQFSAAALWKGMLALCLSLCTVGLSLAANAHEPTFTTFDLPGSTGTAPQSINAAGAITGSYTDASFVQQHGFLRARDGTLTSFDPPGATTTFPKSINPAGEVTGYYADASFVIHGFLRARDGTFTTFNPPGATTTVPQSINPAGAITGTDAIFHGFLRARDGTFTTFDPPGAPSPPSILRARPAPPPKASMQRGRSPELTLTRALCNTASCALATAP